MVEWMGSETLGRKRDIVTGRVGPLEPSVVLMWFGRLGREWVNGLGSVIIRCLVGLLIVGRIDVQCLVFSYLYTIGLSSTRGTLGIILRGIQGWQWTLDN